MSEQEKPNDPPAWQQSVYDQLHEIAEVALRRERPGHSLQPTLLVNDAYLKLMAQRNVDHGDRALVLAVGANIIRRMLVSHARKRKAEKRGGSQGRGLPLHVSVADGANTLDIIELNDALENLQAKNSRAARIVELKFFGGLTGEEIAEQLDVSLRTVNSDWRLARAWLYDVLNPPMADQETQ